jgi:TPR repeat protein
MFMLAAPAKRASEGQSDALTQLERLGNEGDTVAEHYLGHLNLSGRGVPKDANEAYGWLLEASRNGHKEAAEYVRRIQARAKPPAEEGQAK